MDLAEFKKVLTYSWNKETSVSNLRDNWSIDNPSLGQCDITALVVNDYFGGKIMRFMTSSGIHYYNLIDNEIVDLTAEQFLEEIPRYEDGEERTREYLLNNEDTKDRYYKLLNNVKYSLSQAKSIIVNKTIEFYNDNAEKYIEETRYGKLNNLYNSFLKLLPSDAYILDFGCGSGRDSKYFIEQGYKVMAVDGSEKMCELTSKYIGQEVKCMRFDELNIIETFDGIWACSSILHVDRGDLSIILSKMLNALKDNGIIYTCFKKGDYCEMSDNKFYNYITKEIMKNILEELDNKSEIESYQESITSGTIRRPKVIWSNYLIRKKKGS